MNLIQMGLGASLMLGAMIAAPDAAASKGVEVEHLGSNNTLIRITGDSKYILLPVQESNDDAGISILVDGKLDRNINNLKTSGATVSGCHT